MYKIMRFQSYLCVESFSKEAKTAPILSEIRQRKLFRKVEVYVNFQDNIRTTFISEWKKTR